MWIPGQPVDRYVLKAPVADDAAGAWWRVRHQFLGGTFLLRLSPPEAPRDALLRAAQIQAKVLHPQLLRAIDCFELDGRICLVTDLVDVQTLGNRLRQGVFSPTEALKVWRGLTGAVGALHAQGFLHLDLQPERIFWCGGTPRIADFRLARAVGDPDIRGGNPCYLAPELLNGSTADARSDIFALGCVAYEMLKGAPPFSGPGPRTVPALTDLPPSWIALLDRCLRPEPGGRYPQIASLLRAIDEIEPRKGEEPRPAEPEPARQETPPVRPVERAMPPGERAPTPAAERPVTPVTVEVEPRPEPRPVSREPEVTTRWGTVLGLGLLSGVLITGCAGVIGAGWWYSNQPAAPMAAANPVAAVAAHHDTGAPPAPTASPPVARPAHLGNAPPTPNKAATASTVSSTVAAPSGNTSGENAAPPTEDAAPGAANAATPGGHSTVTFTGATVPPTVEVTCRGGFRTRAKVSGQKVEVEGMPTEGECFMYLKDVVATPAPIRAGRNYTCEVTGTTTKCR